MSVEWKEDWERFELEEFPPACLGRQAGSMTWEQVDAVAAACIAARLGHGPLDAECRGLLDDAILRLAEIVAVAGPDERPYFETLMQFAERAREEDDGG